MPTAAARSSPTSRSTTLLYSSEGWFSAVYLNLRTLSERGELPDRQSDIYAIFTAAMIDPLPAAAAGVSGGHGACRRIYGGDGAALSRETRTRSGCSTALTEQNAFVKRLPGRRDLPLPPHDERVRRAHASGRWQTQTAAALLGALRRLVRAAWTVSPRPRPPTAGAGTLTRCCASYRRTRASCWRR